MHKPSMCVHLGAIFHVLAQSHQVWNGKGGWQGATSSFKRVVRFPGIAAELVCKFALICGFGYSLPQASSNVSITLASQVDTQIDAFCSFFFHFPIPGCSQLSGLVAAPGHFVTFMSLSSLPPFSHPSPGAAVCIEWLELEGLSVLLKVCPPQPLPFHGAQGDQKGAGCSQSPSEMELGIQAERATDC